MQKLTYVHEIFSPCFTQWGLRGSPWFWLALKQHFEEMETLLEGFTAEDLAKEIHSFFKLETGVELSMEAEPNVRRYDHGGMSHGMVSGAFILTRVLPTLCTLLYIAKRAPDWFANISTYGSKELGLVPFHKSIFIGYLQNEIIQKN